MYIAVSRAIYLRGMTWMKTYWPFKVSMVAMWWEWVPPMGYLKSPSKPAKRVGIAAIPTRFAGGGTLTRMTSLSLLATTTRTSVPCIRSHRRSRRLRTWHDHVVTRHVKTMDRSYEINCKDEHSKTVINYNSLCLWLCHIRNSLDG